MIFWKICKSSCGVIIRVYPCTNAECIPEMSDNEQKAMQLMAEAEKKLTNPKGFLGLFG